MAENWFTQFVRTVEANPDIDPRDIADALSTKITFEREPVPRAVPQTYSKGNSEDLDWATRYRGGRLEYLQDGRWVAVDITPGEGRF